MYFMKLLSPIDLGSHWSDQTLFPLVGSWLKFLMCDKRIHSAPAPLSQPCYSTCDRECISCPARVRWVCFPPLFVRQRPGGKQMAIWDKCCVQNNESRDVWTKKIPLHTTALNSLLHLRIHVTQLGCCKVCVVEKQRVSWTLQEGHEYCLLKSGKNLFDK